MKEMKAILCILMVFMVLQLSGDSLIEVVDEAELFIERTYKGEMARQLAKTKLQNIVLDKEKTDRQKIEAIQKEFLQPKKEDEITEANAYRLIWTPPLSWDVHSIAIAYDLEQTRTQVISAETVDSKKISQIKANENGSKSSSNEAGSAGLMAGLGYQTKISLAGLLTARPKFDIQASGSLKKDWDESKTELWSKSRQEQLASNFEELTKDIRSKQVSKCHLTFAIDFRSNWNENLKFSATESTVPVYMGRTLVLEAKPENIGNSQMFTIPRKGTVTVKFRGEIDTTQAYKLLEFMKTNTPTILPDKGRIIIYSLSGKVEKAIQESLAVQHTVIHCGEYEWKVCSTWNDRHVTLREALWAVNSLYDKGPFEIKDDECVSMFGKFKCGPYSAMAEAEVYPIVEMDGKFFSRLGKEQLDSMLPEKGVRFHMGSINSYTHSNDYAPKFYELLLKDLLSVEGQDENGEIKYALGYMYATGKGTSSNMTEAFEWYLKAAGQGNTNAQNYIGMLLYYMKEYAEAVEWYRKAAEQGHAGAQFNLGNCYFFSNGVEKDMLKAVEWYHKAAEQGHAGAQFNLGWCYELGNGVTKDMMEAVKWYRKAAEQGHAGAQFNLGNCYFFSNGVEKDMLKAVEWYHKAAEQGDADAQYNLGLCYEKGDGVTKDMTEAVKWYRKAAERGNANAQNSLGLCYEKGDGVTKDMTEAVKWFRKAAEQGDVLGQATLGLIYREGMGVRKNMDEAVKWYRKAAEQGNAGAQNWMGVFYERGEIVEKDMTKAVEWYRRAAEQGNAIAQFNLYHCYYNGLGVVKNMTEAIKWCQKSAEHGNAIAQVSLGLAYEIGEQVEQNMTEAVKWYRKAAEQGDDFAIKKLQKLK